MKEKRYTLPEEQDAAFASEPQPAYHGNAAMALPEEEVDEMEAVSDDIDWTRMPFTGGPTNEEEAIARIEAIEADYERTGNDLTDIEDFERELEAKYPWLI